MKTEFLALMEPLFELFLFFVMLSLSKHVKKQESEWRQQVGQRIRAEACCS